MDETHPTNPEGPVEAFGRASAAEPARQAARALEETGVTAIALTFVDNAGITRAKAVPVARLEAAAQSGIGMSPVFDVFLVDDSTTTSQHIGGPTGDLRLLPDIGRLVALAGQPGWAWAPVDRFTQDGAEYAGCQRSFARRMAREAEAAGLTFRMGFEIEWAVSRGDGDEFSPACQGPAYGMTRIVELSDYSRDLLDALAAEGVAVAQFHPEYASSQLELSTDPADPVAAADISILVRETVRAVSLAHGLRVSFAPRVEAETVGNGGHLHLSAWANGNNLFAGGLGPYGLSDRGESLLARLLESLPALCGVGAPSVASYLRLVPSHWAGCYQCWGLENREAALRLVTGPFGTERSAANAEIKCFDLAANPYLLVGSVMAVALDGLERGMRLPTEVYGDPVVHGDDDALAMLGIARLPTSLAAATDALESHALLRQAMGEPLFGAILAVRRAEAKLFDGRPPEDSGRGDALAVLMPPTVDGLRLVDEHCHGVWSRPLLREEFESGLSESVAPPPPGTSAFDSQLGISVRRWCAPVLDLEMHATADEYVARRAQLGADEVHRRLLTAAGLAGLFVDTGYQPTDLTGFEVLGELAGAPAREIVRLESVAEAMVARGATPAELITGFPAALDQACRHAVALKSVAAYRVGLDIPADRPADDEVRAAAENWIRECHGTRPRLADPVLERFVLWCGVDRGLPLQFHCGFGDPDLTLHRSDPSLLTEFIRVVGTRSVPVVLLHNYPYHRNAAYLAHAFPHVYADVGLALGHAGPGSAAVIAETLEIAPFHKVLYSSDGFALAELHFLGALRFRHALGALLDDRLAAGELSAADADRIARMIGHDNALRLYGPLA